MLPFILLGISFLSFWMRRPLLAVAGPVESTPVSNRSLSSLFLAGSLLLGLFSGFLSWLGLSIFLLWALLWFYYLSNRSLLLFSVLVAASYLFKFHLLPGFTPHWITPKFSLGFDSALLGIIPLSLLIPLASSKADWIKTLKGFLLGCGGIALLAVAALASGAVHLQPHLPSFAAARYLNNFCLVAIPEEAFYRGFIQQQLCNSLRSVKGGKAIALILSSLLFTLAHLYWTPSPDLFAFVFLAGLLYGGVYLISGVESAILTHFLLNFIHMTFFSYHAM